MRFSRSASIVASLLFVLVTVQTFGAASVQFALAVNYNTGVNGANAIVTIDLNGDNFPDIVAATNSGVAVLLNNGDGTYGSPTVYPTGGPLSNGLVVTDVNNDTFPDIVITNMCTDPTVCSGVAVLLGNGDGTFQPYVGYDSGGLETGAVAVADINNDSFPDLILTSNCQAHTCAGGSLSLMLGNGDGTFQKATTLLASKGGPVAIADLNHDGNMDLVTGAGVFLGNGDGTFNPGQNVPGGAVSIVLMDLNNDTKLDAVIAIATGVDVLLGNGDGSFQAPLHYSSGGGYPLSVAVADFNGDGYPDIAVTNECNNVKKNVCNGMGTVGVLAGKGDGTFQAPVAFLGGGQFGTGVSAMDVNGDTKVDLVVSNACPYPGNCANNTGDLSVLINIFTATVTTKVTSSTNPVQLEQPVTFTATLTSSSAVPDGSSVSFFDGTTFLGSTSTLGGVAMWTTSFTRAGNHAISASYAGDLYHHQSKGSVVEVVTAFPSMTTVSTSLTPSPYKQNVTFTATVTSAEAGSPTGTVTFAYGSTTLGYRTLSGGTASFTTNAIPIGTWTITATYHGDSQSTGSSGTTTQVIF